MKTLTIECFEYEELSDEAKAIALEEYQKQCDNDGDIPWMDEIMDSMKKLIEMMDFKLNKWSIGPYAYSYMNVEGKNDSWEDLSGRRAFAFVENHLFQYLRIPWKGKKRWEVAKYKGYSAGRVPSCPLTGVCYDDDFIDHLMNQLRDGSTIKEALESLATEASKLMELECENKRSKEYFIDHCVIDNTYFTEDGIEIDNI